MKDLGLNLNIIIFITNWWKVILIFFGIMAGLSLIIFSLCQHKKNVLPIEKELDQIHQFLTDRPYNSKICIISGLSNLSNNFLVDHDPLLKIQPQTTIGKVNKTIFAYINNQTFTTNTWTSALQYLSAQRPCKPFNSLVFNIGYTQLSEDNYTIAAKKILEAAQESNIKLYIIITDLHLNQPFQTFLDLLDQYDDEQIIGITNDDKSFSTNCLEKAFKSGCDKLSRLIYEITVAKIAKKSASLDLTSFWLNCDEEIYNKLKPLITRILYNCNVDFAGIYFTAKKLGKDMFLKPLFAQRIMLDDINYQKILWPSSNLEIGTTIFCVSLFFGLFASLNYFINNKCNQYIQEILLIKTAIEPAQALVALGKLQKTSKIIGTLTYTNKARENFIKNFLNPILIAILQKIEAVEQKMLSFQKTEKTERVDWLSDSSAFFTLKEYLTMSNYLYDLKKNYDDFIKSKQILYLIRCLNILNPKISLIESAESINETPLPLRVEHNITKTIEDKSIKFLNQFYASIGAVGAEFENQCIEFINQIQSDEPNIAEIYRALHLIVSNIDSEFGAIDSITDIQNKSDIIDLNYQIKKCPYLSHLPQMQNFLNGIKSAESVATQALLKHKIFAIANNETKKIEAIKEIYAIFKQLKEYGFFENETTLKIFIENLEKITNFNIECQYCQKKYIQKIITGIEKELIRKIQFLLPSLLQLGVAYKAPSEMKIGNIAVREALAEEYRNFEIQTHIDYYKKSLYTKVANPIQIISQQERYFSSKMRIIEDINQCKTRREMFHLMQKQYSNTEKTILQALKEDLIKYERQCLEHIKESISAIAKDTFPFKANAEKIADMEQINQFINIIDQNKEQLKEIIDFQNIINQDVTNSDNLINAHTKITDYAEKCISLANLISGLAPVKFQILLRPINIQPNTTLSPKIINDIRVETSQVMTIVDQYNVQYSYGFNAVSDPESQISCGEIKQIQIKYTLSPASEFCFIDNTNTKIIRTYNQSPLFEFLKDTKEGVSFPIELKRKKSLDGATYSFNVDIKTTKPSESEKMINLA